jgi:hypothetical protein
VNLFCLGSDQIDQFWDEFSEHVERLRRLGIADPDELRDDLRLAKKQLWGVQDGRVIGIAITRITGTVCEIYAAAGTQTMRGQIQQLYAEIERWAPTKGCSRIRIIGRRGWKRALKGFEETGVVLEKEI